MRVELAIYQADSRLTTNTPLAIPQIASPLHRKVIPSSSLPRRRNKAEVVRHGLRLAGSGLHQSPRSNLRKNHFRCTCNFQALGVPVSLNRDWTGKVDDPTFMILSVAGAPSYDQSLTLVDSTSRLPSRSRHTPPVSNNLPASSSGRRAQSLFENADVARVYCSFYYRSHHSIAATWSRYQAQPVSH